MQMVDEMMELTKCTRDLEEEEYFTNTTATPPPPTPNSPNNYPAEQTQLLSGAAAEEAGAWLIALKALTVLVVNSCRFQIMVVNSSTNAAALLSDLEEARGYELLKHMVLFSSDEKRPEILAEIGALVGKFL